MNLTTTNLFPLPYWAPALQRVPIPLQVLNEAFVHGDRSLEGTRCCASEADERFAPIQSRGTRELARRTAHMLWSRWTCQAG